MVMKNMAATQLKTRDEATILRRVIKPEVNDFSPAAARAILKMTFEESDKARMSELLGKNRVGSLSAPEEVELDGYLHVGLLLDILHSKARLALKKRALPRSNHGR